MHSHDAIRGAYALVSMKSKHVSRASSSTPVRFKGQALPHPEEQEGETPSRLSSVLGEAQQLLFVVDQEGTVLEASLTTAALFGERTGSIGRKCFELMRGRTRDASFSCSPACPWLTMARTGGPPGPTHVTMFPGAPSASEATSEFRLTHVPLMGLDEPVVVHLLEDVGKQTRHGRVGARLDSLQTRDRSVIEPLTAREFDVLCLIAEGLDSGQIAAQLGGKATTVRTHTARIFGKLGARNRAEALFRFLLHGPTDERVIRAVANDRPRHGGGRHRGTKRD